MKTARAASVEAIGQNVDFLLDAILKDSGSTLVPAALVEVPERNLRGVPQADPELCWCLACGTPMLEPDEPICEACNYTIHCIEENKDV